MATDLKDNLFAKICFPSIEEAERYARLVKDRQLPEHIEKMYISVWPEYKNRPDNSEKKLESSIDNFITNLIEEVFKFTVTKDASSSFGGGTSSLLVFLEELEGSDMSNLEIFERALFERLLLSEPSKHLVQANKLPTSSIDEHTVQDKCIIYLFECYKRLTRKVVLKEVIENEDALETVNALITCVVTNAATSLNQPDLYEGQRTCEQVSVFEADSFMI